MILSEISLFQLRNLIDSTLEFSPNINLFIGQNGQGKTNLAEAIHLLSTTKSFRTAKIPELTKWDQKEASVFGKVTDANGDFSLGIIFSKKAKTLLINNTAESAAKFISRFVSITFSPADIELIKGDPLIRRNFLDKHCADVYPFIIPHLLQYNRALKNKQALLKSGSLSISGADIQPWNRLLAQHGAAIYKVRSSFIEKLLDKASYYHQQFATDDGSLSIALQTASSIDGTSAHDEQYLFELLSQYEQKEIESRRTLVGPHRDDLVISFSGIGARKFSSQGQAKSLALSLKLGLIDFVKEERGETPVIVLDDVDSELDLTRLNRLYQLLLSTDAQVFITGTQVNPAVQDVLKDVRRFAVSHGSVKPVEK